MNTCPKRDCGPNVTQQYLNQPLIFIRVEVDLMTYMYNIHVHTSWPNSHVILFTCSHFSAQSICVLFQQATISIFSLYSCNDRLTRVRFNRKQCEIDM